jgi:hypothetical protein
MKKGKIIMFVFCVMCMFVVAGQWLALRFLRQMEVERLVDEVKWLALLQQTPGRIADDPQRRLDRIRFLVADRIDCQNAYVKILREQSRFSGGREWSSKANTSGQRPRQVGSGFHNSQSNATDKAHELTR